MGCCWPSRNTGHDEELGRNNKKDEDQPLIDNKKSPNGGKGKGKNKQGKAVQEPNPFHKPSKSISVFQPVLVSSYLLRRGLCHRGNRRGQEGAPPVQCQ